MEEISKVRLVATRDIPGHVQCVFSMKKGEERELPRSNWNAKKRIYRVVTGHGTYEDIKGLEEVS